MKPGLPDVVLDVLLATFNGGRYLPEQLASIEAQEGVRWRLIASDDGSSDDSLTILEAFRERHPGRVEVLSSTGGRSGPTAAFGRLMQSSSAPYVFLCDQDDVWVPDKLRRSLEVLVRGEERAPGVPMLVHTDLIVVDSNLRVIHESMNRYQHLRAERRKDIRRLLVQNAVTGCTAGMNRRLVDQALPIPADAVMHDWWLALVAASLGEVLYVREPLVQYRQHGANVRGARRLGLPRKGASVADLREALRITYAQAAALVDRMGPSMPAEEYALATAYSSLATLGPVSRRTTAIRNRFFKGDVVKTLAMMLVM